MADDDMQHLLQGLQEHKDLLQQLQDAVHADPSNTDAKEVR